MKRLILLLTILVSCTNSYVFVELPSGEVVKCETSDTSLKSGSIVKVAKQNEQWIIIKSDYMTLKDQIGIVK